jgi:endonuclease III
MANSHQQAIAQTLLQQYGQTFADELDIDIAQNAPAPLFQLLCGTILFSARINSTIAINSMNALRDRGWTTADKMADSTWDERVEALTEGGYTRYRERTATMFGDTVEKLMDEYDGDLRQLRDRAEQSPDEERSLLKEFKGIGDVGVDIFFREVQSVWDELYPFIDKKAQSAAKKLDLPTDAEALIALSDRADFPKLMAALVRVDLDDAYDPVTEAAKASR